MPSCLSVEYVDIGTTDTALTKAIAVTKKVGVLSGRTLKSRKIARCFYEHGLMPPDGNRLFNQFWVFAQDLDPVVIGKIVILIFPEIGMVLVYQSVDGYVWIKSVLGIL